MENLFVRGLGILLIRETALKIVAFIGNIILARLLSPEYFGLFVILSFVISFFALFTDIGLSSAIIQQKDKISRQKVTTIFLTRQLLSILIVILLWIVAPYIKFFYHQIDSNAIFALRIFSLSILIGPFSDIGISLLEREFKYNLISLIDAVGVVAYQVTAIICALMGFYLWSFIIAIFVKEILEGLLVVILKPWKPTLTNSLKSIKTMLSFGLYLQMGGLLTFLHDSVNPLIAGILNGSSAVGLLDWASSLALIPKNLTDNYGRVAFAGFSRIQDDDVLIKETIETSISLLSLIIFLFGAIMVGFGNEIIHYLYPPVWYAGIPALFWYVLGTFFFSFISPLGQLALAKGASKLIFYASILFLLVEWFSAIILSKMIGFSGISIAFFIAQLTTAILYLIIFKTFDIKIELRKLLLPKLLILIVIYIFILLLNLIIPHNIYLLIFKISAVLGAYVAMVYFFARKDFSKFTYFIFKSIRFNS